MKLSYLVEEVDFAEVINKKDVEIANISNDSRSIKENTLFICIKGENFDGHDYISQAIENGAVAVVVSNEYQGDMENMNAVFIKTANTELALAQISCAYFDNPSRKFKLIGVTGTKGKTTTTYMIKSILEKAGKKVGLIGTINNIIGEKKYTAHNTTPNALELQTLFYKMAEEKVDVVVMEVSSHGLALDRVYGSDFDIGVFTNLSQEHLDFHGTFDNYIEAKSKLFKMCKNGYVNCDDIYSLKIEKNATCPITTYGLDNGPKITAKDLIITNSYVEFKIMVDNRPQKIRVGIPGRFTVYNALAAISAVSLLNLDFEAIQAGLESVVVPGRSEMVPNMHGKSIMIDYAHTPSSMESILKTVKMYTKGKIYCVFGCGGNRDTAKRAMMGEIAGKLADLTIITTDNPRKEELKDINAQIIEGLKRTKGKYKVIIDRAKAIEYAIKESTRADIVLLLGKGHETYQILRTGKIHFDEREVVSNILKKLPIPEDII